MQTDLVVGLQHGDEGKGKITHHLLKSGQYTHVTRSSGGPNAGHTIYHEGRKFITHHLPAGVFYEIPSVIGAGCVVNPQTLMEEIEEFEGEGFKVRDFLQIANNVHVITPEHVDEDAKTDKIGSTKRGIMPVYRDKYARVGMRMQDFCEEDNALATTLKPLLCDSAEVLYGDEHRILVEGAQGFSLCPDWGFYPFVTSSPPTTSYALHSLGVPPQTIGDVWGVAKMYDTYVGTKSFQPEGEIFNRLRELGGEYGATTGRPRQCNWLNLNHLERAIKVNGVTHLVFNKCDIMEELGEFAMVDPDCSFDSLDSMKRRVLEHLNPLRTVQDIYWSGHKDRI